MAAFRESVDQPEGSLPERSRMWSGREWVPKFLHPRTDIALPYNILMRVRGLLAVWTKAALLSVLCWSLATARQLPPGCGTHPLKLEEEMFLHRQAKRKHRGPRTALAPRLA